MLKPNKGGGGDTGGNTINGSRRDDVLVSTSGNDTVKASSGQDTLVLNGSVWDYDWSRSSQRGIDWELTDTSGGTGTDHGNAIELRSINLTVYFKFQFRILCVEVGEVIGSVGAVSTLHRQFAHPLQHIGDFRQTAFCCLRQ